MNSSFAWEIKYPPVKFSVLRILLIFFALFGVPSLLSVAVFKNNNVLAVSVSALCAAAAGIMPLRAAAIKKICRKDFKIVFKSFCITILLSPVATCGWTAILDFTGIKYAQKQQVAEFINLAAGRDAVLFFAAICVFIPIAEEILFRRIIYSLWRSLHSSSAFAGTALLFSLAHFFIAGIPGLFIVGVMLQYVFIKSRNLSAAILMHALINTSAFLVELIFS